MYLFGCGRDIASGDGSVRHREGMECEEVEAQRKSLRGKDAGEVEF